MKRGSTPAARRLILRRALVAAICSDVFGVRERSRSSVRLRSCAAKACSGVSLGLPLEFLTCAISGGATRKFRARQLFSASVTNVRFTAFRGYFSEIEGWGAQSHKAPDAPEVKSEMTGGW